MGDTIRIWVSETGERILVAEPLQGESSCLDSVACSRDEKLTASGSNDKTVRLWDARACKQIGRPLAGHTDVVRSVCFSFDSNYLASAFNDRSIHVWGVKTRSLVRKLEGHTDYVLAVAFSPDGRNVLSGSSDCTVRFWNIERLASADTCRPPAGNPAWAIGTFEFLPGSNHEFASGAEDETMRTWDTQIRTDDKSYSENKSIENEFRTLWNWARSSLAENDGWLRDIGRLYLWVPWQFRHDINLGTKPMTGKRVKDIAGPVVDYLKVFGYSGPQWKDNYDSTMSIYNHSTFESVSASKTPSSSSRSES